MKVREAILAVQERKFGGGEQGGGRALYNLGNAYGRLGDHAKSRADTGARAPDLRTRVR